MNKYFNQQNFAPLTCPLMLLISANTIADDDWDTSVLLRERVTHLSAVEFDEDSDEAGLIWTQRLTLKTQYQFNETWSITAGLLSALQEGVPESPAERNHLDIHLASVNYKTDNTNTIIGRQTLKLGSQRLIGWRDGTNVRRAWQGLRTTWQINPHWRSDWFALEAIGVKPNGIFNDDAQHENRLAGGYHTLDLEGLGWSSVSNSGLDIYYLYTNRDDRNTIEGQANQVRHSVGVRYFADTQNWFWNWEAVYQTGRHGSDDIRAWTLATNTGYKFDAQYSPQIMASINIASGDEKNGDGELNTFDALFPKGDYFSGAAILGPANFYNVHLYFTFNPRQDITVVLDSNIYWRLENEDGVYGPPGNLFARPGQSESDTVNWSYSAALQWERDDSFDAELLVTYARAGEFLRESGLNDDTLFVECTLSWRLF